MALPDLTGQNIQDTFQRVLQTDATGSMRDGTGSLFLPVSASHAVTASYAVSASHEITYELSSSFAETASYVNSTTLDTFKQTGIRSGDGFIDGNITASGMISASGTGIHDIGGNLLVHGKLKVLGSLVELGEGHITASGNISASGNLTGEVTNVKIVGSRQAYRLGTLNSVGNGGVDVASFGGSEEIVNLAADSAITEIHMGKASGAQSVTFNGNVTASNDIGASGMVYGHGLRVQGKRIAYDSTNNYIDIKDTGLDIQGGNLTLTNSGNGHITASGEISASGNIYADDVRIPNTSKISNIAGATYMQINASQLAFYAGGVSMASFQTSTGVVINGGGNINVDFRVEGDTDEYLFFTDAGADKVAIGTNTVGNSLLTIDGDTTLTNITASGEISSSDKITAPQFDARTSGTGYKLSGTKALYTHDNSTVVGRTARLTLTGSSARFGRAGDDMHVTASGNISASGDGYFNNVTIADDLNVTDDIIVENMSTIKVGSTSVVSFQATQALFQENVKIQDNDKLLLGNSDSTNPYENDMEMWHDGTDTHFKNNHGVLNISSSNGLLFKSDVTASGNISASGNNHILGGFINTTHVAGIGDTDTRISLGESANRIDIMAGGSIEIRLDSGNDFPVTLKDQKSVV